MLEVGVLYGKNAINIYESFNIDKLYLVDQWREKWEHYHNENIHKYFNTVVKHFDTMDNVIIIKASSLEVDCIQDEYFDYIYLDANHSAEHVTRELPMYFKYLKEGGMFAGDNLENAGVKVPLDEFCSRPHIDKEYEQEVYKQAAKSNADVSEWWFIK